MTAFKELSLQCIDRIEETYDTATFLFDGNSAGFGDYKPGQFTSLKVDIDGASHYRAYTISSTPTRDTPLALTIKRVKNGLVSNHLIDSLEPGMTVTATAPAGAFNIADIAPSRRYVFVSAGCGITPVMSMARYLLDTRPEAEIHFIHCARTIGDVIFAKELKQLDAEFENFHLDIVLTKMIYKGYLRGPFTAELFEELAPELNDSAVFTCGPETFMTMLRESLDQRGFDMSRFHQESFGQAQALSSNGDDAKRAAQAKAVKEEKEAEANRATFEVSFPTYGKSVKIEEGEILAKAIDEAGVPFAISCRSGLCGQCRCTLTDGEVKSTSFVELTDEDIENGVVLACASRVLSNVSVERG